MKKTLSILLSLLSLFISVAGAREIEREKDITFSNIAPGEYDKGFDKKFTVRIMFASKTKVTYAGVYVRVFDASGIAVFKHLCEKPWLFLRLPAGRYNVVAVDRKKVLRQAPFAIFEKQTRPTQVTLKWPKDIVGY